MARHHAAPDPQQLTLFEAPVPVAAPTSTTPIDRPEPATPVATSRAVEPVSEPPVSIASVLSPAVFRHPQSDREIRLDDHLVGYALKRARRRSIGFIIGIEGLSVNAPKWVGLHDIEVALQGKAAWILRKLRSARYRLSFVDLANVKQGLNEGQRNGLTYFTEPGMVVVHEVTKDNVSKAVDQLVDQGFFNALAPIGTSA